MASILLLFISCSNNKGMKHASELEGITTFTPKMITSFDHAGDYYFGHLGYESIVLENGNYIIPDRQLTNILLVNEAGEVQKVVEKGRGPGEILDAYQFSQDSEGRIYTYDQRNKKILVFNEQLGLVKEILPPKYKFSSLLKAYKMEGRNYLFELVSFEYLRNPEKERETIFVQYNAGDEAYGKELVLRAKPSALTIVDGKVRGSTAVEYTFEQLAAYNSERQTLYLFNTDSPVIAEVDFNFDTLSTIPVNLPLEKVSQAEKDSLEKAYDDPDQWRTVEPLLPEIKSAAGDMKYKNGVFWLKSFLRGAYQKWFVLNEKGQILCVVNLPKKSILTHISEQNIGLRLDDTHFALYENPVSELLK
jgi:hypothetical protein